MGGRERKSKEPGEYGPVPSESLSSESPQSVSLKEAMRQARIESAERTGVVVDLRDAELARLELLNEALDPLFAQIPDGVELFDRGISKGDTPRLWLDAVAHVAMGRDKRVYRLLQDGRYGRKILAESQDIPEMVAAITHYVATRLIERERALSEASIPLPVKNRRTLRDVRSHMRWRLLRMFIFGLIVGSLALFAALWIVAWRLGA
mgnify:CR=1 FL=1|jgi:hypothetical protein